MVDFKTERGMNFYIYVGLLYTALIMYLTETRINRLLTQSQGKQLSKVLFLFITGKNK